jgi:hypothetical protein
LDQSQIHVRTTNFDRALAALKKQVLKLENQLELKNHELIDLRNQLLLVRTNATLSVLRGDRAERALQRTRDRISSLQNKLDSAYDLVTRRDAELSELRELIHELQQKAQPVLVEEMLERMSVDATNRDAMRRLRAEIIFNESLKAYSTSAHLTRMLERQMQSVRKWDEKRNAIQQGQRTELKLVLEGMRLLYTPLGRSTRPRPNSPIRTVRVSGPFVITNLTRPDMKTETVRAPYDPGPVDNGVDAAIINASAHVQEIEPELERGVVAEPISTGQSLRNTI